MNYWDGAQWTAIPSAALASTYRGTYHVEYPAASAYAGDGTPCAAIGRPRIVIEAPMMTDTGFGFWRALFSDEDATYASLSIEAFDERTGTDTKWAGYLERPTHGGISGGSDAGHTWYRDVRIVIGNCIAG